MKYKYRGVLRLYIVYAQEICQLIILLWFIRNISDTVKSSHETIGNEMTMFHVTLYFLNRLRLLF